MKKIALELLIGIAIGSVVNLIISQILGIQSTVIWLTLMIIFGLIAIKFFDQYFIKEQPLE